MNKRYSRAKAYRNNTMLSIVCDLLIVAFTLISVFSFVLGGGDGNMSASSVSLFRYYTFDSNILMAICACFSIYFDWYSIHNNTDFTDNRPKWFIPVRLTCTATICVTLLVVFLFLGPTIGYKSMLEGANIFVHLLTPLMAVFTFIFCRPSHSVFSLKMIPIVSIPTLLYASVYFCQVILIGEDNGGWSDFYGFLKIGVIPALLFCLLLCFGSALLLRLFRKKADAMFDAHTTDENDSLFDVSTISGPSLIKTYEQSVFKTAFMIAPATGLCSGITFTFCKIFGFFDFLNSMWLSIFDICCIFYCLVAYTFIKLSMDENKYIPHNSIQLGKILLVILIVFHWNFISYLIPSRDFWGYAFLFILLVAFFLDKSLLNITSGLIAVSMVISWIVKGDLLLPNRDDFFIPNIILRGVCYIITVSFLNIIIYFAENNLVFALEDISERDALTNAYNRHNMEKYMTIAARHVDKHKSPELWIGMVDIDDFKKCNDTFGHEMGDQVLLMIARQLMDHIGTNGKVFRFGGEEFLCYLETNETETLQIMNEIVDSIRNTAITTPSGQLIYTTVTIGLSSYSAEHNLKASIHEADNNLYVGKQSGKNRIQL